MSTCSYYYVYLSVFYATHKCIHFQLINFPTKHNIYYSVSLEPKCTFWGRRCKRRIVWCWKGGIARKIDFSYSTKTIRVTLRFMKRERCRCLSKLSSSLSINHYALLIPKSHIKIDNHTKYSFIPMLLSIIVWIKNIVCVTKSLLNRIK